MARAFNVAGPELIRSRVRVNPSEQQQEADQQEGHGRGRKERESRGGCKRAAKGASSGLPGRAPIRKHGGGGGRVERDGREEEREGGGGRGEGKGGPGGNRRVLRLTRRSWGSHHEDGRPSPESGVQPPRRGAAIGWPHFLIYILNFYYSIQKMWSFKHTSFRNYHCN